MKKIWMWCAVLALGACGQGQEKPKTEAPKPAASTPAAKPSETPKSTNEWAVIKTDFGEMVVEFWPEVAPKTVENFKKLASEKFYDGTAFHRVVQGFMIQGGDPLSKTDSREVGSGGPGPLLKAEFNERKHVRGVISMARSRHPDSAGSQFFICLDPAPNLDGKYTGFGRLVKGEDVLLKIGEQPVEMNYAGNERSKPIKRIGVESIRLIPAETTKK